MIEEIQAYKCTATGTLFETETECRKHAEKHRRDTEKQKALDDFRAEFTDLIDFREMSIWFRKNFAKLRKIAAPDSTGVRKDFKHWNYGRLTESGDGWTIGWEANVSEPQFRAIKPMLHWLGIKTLGETKYGLSLFFPVKVFQAMAKADIKWLIERSKGYMSGDLPSRFSYTNYVIHDLSMAQKINSHLTHGVRHPWLLLDKFEVVNLTLPEFDAYFSVLNPSSQMRFYSQGKAINIEFPGQGKGQCFITTCDHAIWLKMADHIPADTAIREVGRRKDQRSGNSS